MRSLAFCAVFAGLVAAPWGAALADPSFDCSKARTADERAICDDGMLSRLDSLVAQSYRSFTPGFQPKKVVARRALADRNDCGGDTVCIASAQLSALQAYGGFEPWVEAYVISQLRDRASQMALQKPDFSPAMPDRPGECVLTRIRDVTTRFGDPLSQQNEDEGTSVVYENGGYGVTYGREPELYGAKTGQPVILCRLSVMYDCPAGDDRGSSYYALDLVTHGSWTLPDAQHMCGGA